MDEVDKIIIHSLRQIGCNIENDDDGAFGISSFTPQLIVRAVARCLEEIKPDLVLPARSLPENMAQRFSVATALAEMCASCGYRGDIGYQTFLYPNEVDVRRLFMFLIEQLPKEHSDLTESKVSEELNDYAVLMRVVRDKIMQQLRAPWVPQYVRAVGNQRSNGCISLSVDFAPQVNVCIPSDPKDDQGVANEARTVQRTTAKGYDVVSTVLHKNAIDLHASEGSTEGVRLALFPAVTPSTFVANRSTSHHAGEGSGRGETNAVDTHVHPLEALNRSVDNLRMEHNRVLSERKAAVSKLNAIRSQQGHILAKLDQLQKEVKTHERICMILENPEENVAKLEGLIQTVRERRDGLEQQWQEYRQPMLARIVELKASCKTKSQQSVLDLRSEVAQLERALREKTAGQMQLNEELKNATSNAAPRQEYTRRIYEFIGNIRKQRNDIYKILDDTRDLQKQLNSVSAQLQRQFNYTDDLLFQSAKQDLHAKQAYKLLASLHDSCNELDELVTRTGQVTKEIRDLEVQVDHERLKNIAASLEQITADTRNIESIIKSVQSEIQAIESESLSAG